MKGILTLFALLFCSKAFAFTFNNSVAAAFAEDRVNISVADFDCTENGLSLDRLENALKTAVSQYWNRVPTSRLKLQVGARKSVDGDFNTGNPCNAGSGCTPNPDLVVSSGILVSCNNNATIFSNPRILGVTLTNNIQGRRLVGSLILLNDGAGSRLADRDEDELVAVLAHEIGHAIGLGHSPVKDSLMYFQTVPTRRSLGQDDRDGVSYLYPASIGSSACGTISTSNAQGGSQGPWPVLLISFLMLALTYALKLVPRR
jgi:hypothetical protein